MIATEFRDGTRRAPVVVAGGGRWAGLSAGLLIVGRLLGPAAAEPTAAPQPATRDRTVSPVHEGYRRYQGVCGHCHGPDGAGSSFAPSLIDPLPTRDRFTAAVLEGVASPRGVMRGFAGDPNVEPYLDAIYAYLAERAAGHLGRGRPDDGGPGSPRP